MENTPESVPTTVVESHSPVVTPSHRTNKIVIAAIIVFVIALVSIIFFISQQQNVNPKKNILQEQAEQYLKSLAKDSLQADVVPQNSHVTETKDDPTRYTAQWKLADNTTGNYAIRFQDRSVYDAVSIIFVLPNKSQNVTVETGSQLAKKYFNVTPKGTWNCETFSNTKPIINATLCENFWTDIGEVKKGLGMITTGENLETSSVFYCELYPGSEQYTDKSCTSYKAESGW